MADHAERGTITAQDLARYVFDSRRLRKADLAANVLVDRLGFVAYPAARLGQTTCDIHVPPQLTTEVASQANSLGFEVTFWHQGRENRPTGRITLTWPGEPYSGPHGRPPPPAGPFYGRHERLWNRLLELLGRR